IGACWTTPCTPARDYPRSVVRPSIRAVFQATSSRLPRTPAFFNHKRCRGSEMRTVAIGDAALVGNKVLERSAERNREESIAEPFIGIDHAEVPENRHACG